MIQRQTGALLSVALLGAASFGACSDDADGPLGGGATGGTGGAGGTATSTTTSTSTQTASSSTATGLPPTFTVSGVVVDQSGDPVAGALVLQGGGEVQATTGADGVFELEVTQAIPGIPTAVAAKVGYRSAGFELESLPSEPLTLTLFAIKPPDNALGYTFGAPGVGDPAIDNSTLFCGHCHTTLAAQFQTSKHAQSAKNPIVHDLYAGVSAAREEQGSCSAVGGTLRDGTTPGEPGIATERCYVGVGVLSDLNPCGAPAGQACDDPALPAAQKPVVFGACADCHALGMDGPAGGRNLLDAEGHGYDDGNHCDACHHVRDIDLAAPPGSAGRLIMQRPREKIGDEISGPTRQAMFGPYPDVPTTFMGGSYQPKFATAEFCAGCHDQKQAALLPGSSLDAGRFPDGLPTHGTYSEWLAGPFNTPTSQCQFCHMPAVDGLVNVVDVAKEGDLGIAFGFARTPEQIRAHTFRGPLYSEPSVPRLLDGALFATLSSTQAGADLDVEVTLANVGCGHAVPTGEPMRSLVLLVSVEGCAQRFEPNGGFTVSDIAGGQAPGVVGTNVALAGSTLTWASSGAVAGDVVRFVRPTGTFWDYDGVGLFEGALLPASEKGMPVLAPLGERTVLSADALSLTLDAAIALQPGDIVYVGDAVPSLAAIGDGDPARSLAGAPGATFAKVLLDPDGARNVPHYRAVDIASDNRIRPGESATTQHRFAIPSGCLQAEIRATVLYRPLPLRLGAERAWDVRDYVAVAETSSVTLLP